eukprot:COSAG02_NODE_18889_length_912_cov_0.858549_2_plen_128_part_01
MVASKAAAQDLMTAVTTTVLLHLVMAMARLPVGDRAWAARRVRFATCAFTASTAITAITAIAIFQPTSLDCNESLIHLMLGSAPWAHGPGGGYGPPHGGPGGYGPGPGYGGPGYGGTARNTRSTEFNM